MAACEPPAEILREQSERKDPEEHGAKGGDSNPHGFTRQILS